MMAWGRKKPGGAPWSEAQTIGVLLGAGGLVLALVCGAGYGLYRMIWPQPAAEVDVTPVGLADVVTTAAPVPTPVGESSAERRDRIAAEPMAQVAQLAASAGSPATVELPGIRIPDPADELIANVPTGFPHTPEGALAQWAAIEEQVLETMCVDVARETWADWVVEGGPEFPQWVLTQDVVAFLDATGSGDCKPSSITVSVEPAAGQVKGADGDDWVVVCALLDITAAAHDVRRFGYGACARMQWQTGRWMVAAGEQPADAPSTLPGTQAAVDAGWRPWVYVAAGG